MDPFTLAVVEGALAEASDEIFATMKRTSQSTIIYEVLDYTTGIVERGGRLITQGNGVTGFLGSLSGAVKELLQSGSPFSEGDVLAVNDPYIGGGTHLSDVVLISPVFLGDELLAFAVAKAHWTEVGGMAPGSWTTDAPDIFAEGIQLPMVHVKKRGELQDDVVHIITRNVRTPRSTYGDLMAQVAAIETGGRRIRGLAEKFGADTVLAAMEDLLQRGERIAREALAALPHGTFSAEDLMDDDGLGGDPVHIKVSITVTDEEFLADFTGTDPEVAGTINCTFPSLECGVRTAFRALLPTQSLTNDGMFAPLRIACPPGTVFTARRPVPVGTYWEASDHSTDLVLKALAPHMGGRIPAGHSLSVCGTIIAFGGEEPKILIEPIGGGWGGAQGQDGESALIPIGDGDTRANSVEIMEAVYPLLAEEISLVEDSCGAGKARGGLGQRRAYRLLEEASVTTAWGRCVFPPWGLDGGESGTPNRVILERADDTLEGGKFTRVPIRRGERVVLRTGGGGGFGAARERACELVRRDLREGIISESFASRHYPRQMEEMKTCASG